MSRISKQGLLSFVGVFAVFTNTVNCECFYTIVAPKHIRPHSDYKVVMTLHDEIKPMAIRLSIEGMDYSNGKEITLNSNQMQMVTLRVDELDVSIKYNLVAQGVSGTDLREETDLKVETKNVSIYIQNDKLIYKPGEKIRFRVLVLDDKLKPVKLPPNTPLNIHLVDSENNRIKKWLNVTPKNGVFTTEAQLSEFPVLGNWTIDAQIGNEKKTKQIEVAEYVLPKFDVSIDSPNDFSVKDGKIRAIVRSKYTHGKLVKGTAIVSLIPTDNPSRSFPRFHPEQRMHQSEGISKAIPINGKGTVEFDPERELNARRWGNTPSRKYEMKATVVEDLTDRNQTQSKPITVHQSRYKVTPSTPNREFNPGNPVSCSVGVSRHDNSPVLVNDKTKWITVEKTMGLCNNPALSNGFFDAQTPCGNDMQKTFKLNENGTTSIEVPTMENETNFNLKAKYMGEETDLGNFHSSPSAADPSTDLDIKVLNKRPTLNKNVSVEVKPEGMPQNLTYQVIAHGKIIYAGNVPVTDSKPQIITFNATFDLFPKATLIVYYFKNNDIVSKSKEIPIDEDLNNFVKLKLSSTETQPGKDVNIDISTKPNSHVGLVGVDQSVLLMKKNDSLTKDDVIHEMNEFQKVPDEDNSRSIWEPKREYTNEYFEPFKNNDVILFTNAKKDLPEFDPRTTYFESPVDFDYLINDIYSIRLAGGPAPKPVEPPRVRTEFPETWLWEDVNVNNPNGSLTLTKKVPDTITSWVITAISVNPETGLGLTKSPKSLKVFQPFFVTMNLPYSVKRGEVVAVPVVLFNYLDTDVDAEIKLHNENDEFEFVDDIKGDKSHRKRQVSVPSDDGVSIIFLVRFTSIGKIPMKVTATSPVAGDATVQVQQVDPEGVPQYVNKALFVDLRENNTFNATQQIDIPKNAVPGSMKMNVNAVGDSLGGTMKNLDQLIRMPTGCGEQNMMNFVPNIVVMDYMNTTDNMNEPIKNKALKYMETGYQRELNYRHDDGSFSAFGKSDGRGSTWLTAFVVKSFKQADKYIDVDPKVIDKALNFLSSTQAPDGSFQEVGHVIHEDMQGGSSNGVALTAYVTIAFLRNMDPEHPKYQETVEKATDNIASNIKNIDSPYAKSIAACALQMADHPKKDEVLNDLTSKSVTEDEQKHWTKSQPGSNAPQSKSIDIEITSYGVLALIEADRLAEVFPYFKWLLAQRNDKGGFVGTQDTVIGLEALASYSQSISNDDNDVQLKVQADNMDDRVLNVTSENALDQQTIDLPPDTTSVNLTANGHGCALFQLSYRYNLKENDPHSTFTLRPRVIEMTDGQMIVEVRARFNPRTANEKHSNMVIMEVAMPSGFLVDKEQLNELMNSPEVPLVETKRGETVAIIYIDQMYPNEILQLFVQGYRSHKVAENKPVPVQIYDYYDSSRSAREFYEVPMTSACDICDGNECSRSCRQ